MAQLLAKTTALVFRDIEQLETRKISSAPEGRFLNRCFESMFSRASESSFKGLTMSRLSVANFLNRMSSFRDICISVSRRLSSTATLVLSLRSTNDRYWITDSMVVGASTATAANAMSFVRADSRINGRLFFNSFIQFCRFRKTTLYAAMFDLLT